MMKKQKGFTLLIAIITTSLLLIVSFVVVNIALSQVVATMAGQSSQHALYAADSAVECAMYWDIKNPVSNVDTGAFDINNPTSPIYCNGNTIPLFVSSPVVVGSVTTSVINFSSTFPDGCADVTVTKTVTVESSSVSTTKTKIDAQGYNTCDVLSLKRFSRGISINY